MAYFANPIDYKAFVNQCDKCIFGADPCPIASVQLGYNLTAEGNETATEILEKLVNADGICEMLERYKDTLLIQRDNISSYHFAK